MGRTMKEFCKKLFSFLRKARGNKTWEIKLFGIQLFLVAKPDKWHTNIFIFYIPILRIDTEPTKFGVNLLLLTWVFKLIKYLFTKWTFVKKENEVQLKFCGMNIFQQKDIVPFRFPTAMFRG